MRWAMSSAQPITGSASAKQPHDRREASPSRPGRASRRRGASRSPTPRRRAWEQQDRAERHAEQDRDDDQHPGGDEDARAALQRGGLVARPRQQALERRAHVRVEVRHAGRVGQDVVAVGADHRREVLDDLEHLQGDQQQQRVDAPRQPDAERDDRDDRVEVDAAEVGAQPRAPRQPVGVRDVRVEGRPDDVDAGAHAARARRRRSGTPRRGRSRGSRPTRPPGRR